MVLQLGGFEQENNPATQGCLSLKSTTASARPILRTSSFFQLEQIRSIVDPDFYSTILNARIALGDPNVSSLSSSGDLELDTEGNIDLGGSHLWVSILDSGVSIYLRGIWNWELYIKYRHPNR